VWGSIYPGGYIISTRSTNSGSHITYTINKALGPLGKGRIPG